MKRSIQDLPSISTNDPARRTLLIHVVKERQETCLYCKTNNLEREELKESTEDVKFNYVLCSCCGFDCLEILENVKND